MSREMKHSGIEWIGEIPKEWNLVPTKRLFSCKKQVAGNCADDYERLALTMQGVIKREKDDNEGLQPEKFDGYQILQRNEIVFKLIDLANVKTSRVGLSPYLGIVSPAYIIIRNNSEDNRFFYYWFMFMYHHNIFNQMGDDGVRSSLNADDVLNIPIANIPLSEQQKIANYLDKVCGEVDELVALQEQMIEELKAYKQSVITEAVTKGLNPNVPMRNSGIDWIGEIPEHWSVCKLKNEYTLLNGRAYSDPELLNEGKYRILRVGNLFSSDKWYYSDMELDDDKFCEAGDLLYGWSASIGPYLWKKERVIYHYHIWKVLFGRNNLHFSYYMLQALTFAKQKDMHGSAMQHLTKINMDNSKIVIPSLSEQQAIASYLDEKCSEIDSLIALKQQKIEELKEYKKSVIYEYVTGKKEIA